MVKYSEHDALCVCVCLLLLPAFPTGLSLEEVREYERKMQEETNCKVKSSQNSTGEAATPDLFCHNTEDGMKHIGGCESVKYRGREKEFNMQ